MPVLVWVRTSVLLAGLFPELRKRDYRPIYVRTLEDPLRDLKAAFARECGLSADENSLRALLQQGCEDGSPVIAFDQFEEFLIRFRDQPAKRAEFVREVAAVIADESVDARVIFSVREDYLAALDDMQRRLPHLFTQSYRLMPLTAFGAREAIVRPLLKTQVPYDERLVTRLVDELAKFDFESARLQITCAELYRSAFEREGVQIHLSEEDLGLLEKQLRELEWKSTVETYGSAIASSPLTTSQGALLGGVFQRYLQRAIAPVEARNPFVSRVVLDEMISRQETNTRFPLASSPFASPARRRLCATCSNLWPIEILSASGPAPASHGTKSCTSVSCPRSDGGWRSTRISPAFAMRAN